jgi:hypothetical protein
MSDISMRQMYPSEGDARCIAVKLAEPRQLFDTLDPAPFHERDLDREAAEYLLAGARELARAGKVKIVLHFPELPETKIVQDIGNAIRHYFHYREIKLRQQRRQLWRTGRHALLVGLGFLVICSMIAWSLAGREELWLKLSREGIIILGWVAMWRPIEIFLYDWWPLMQEQRHCRRLQQMPVDVRQRVRPG